MQNKYTQSYQALGFDGETSWPELKAAYRTLIKRWHPDRYEQNTDERKRAEDKAKKINEAYSCLADYYKKFADLPPFSTPKSSYHTATINPSTATSEATAETTQRKAETPVNDTASETSAATHSKGDRNFKSRIAVVGILLAVGYFIFYRPITEHAPEYQIDKQVSAVQESDSQQPKQDSVKQHRDNRSFTIGSSLGEVYNMQGVPTKTEESVWYYGNSKVFFIDGRVSDWDNHPDNPLKVNVGSPMPVVELEPFDKGSTKAHVRAVQGIPQNKSDNVWDYGRSRIYFENGRVVEWDESPLNPLQVKK